MPVCVYIYYINIVLKIFIRRWHVSDVTRDELFFARGHRRLRRIRGGPITFRRRRVRPPAANNRFWAFGRGVRRTIVHDFWTTHSRNVTRTRQSRATIHGGGRLTFRRWRSSGPVFSRYRTRRPIVHLHRRRTNRSRRDTARRRRLRPTLGRNGRTEHRDARTSGSHATFDRCVATTVRSLRSVAGVVVVST